MHYVCLNGLNRGLNRGLMGSNRNITPVGQDVTEVIIEERKKTDPAHIVGNTSTITDDSGSGLIPFMKRNKQFFYFGGGALALTAILILLMKKKG